MAIRIPRRRVKRPAPDAMTVVEHLSELRRRVIVSVVALAAGAVVCFALFNHILAFFVHPYCTVLGPHKPCNLYITGPLEGFGIRLKVAGYGGLFLSSPVIFWQLWRFVTPGLHPHEKRYAVPFLASSVLLFLGGATVAWFTFPHALQFLTAVGGPTLKQIFSPNSYLSLIILLMVIFGASFEFPLLLVFLELAGVLSPSKLVEWRRRAIVILVAFAAIITPSSDPFSMLALAVPLVLFYELAIRIGKLLTR
jgi:sec-independent protein translocase protein TatC